MYVSQSDSIYKVNKVKLRKWYVGNMLVATTYFDREGRTVKIKHSGTSSGSQRTAYYEYNKNGLLINRVDTTVNRIPDEEAIKRFKLDISKLNKRPKFEVRKYKIEHSNNSILKITQFTPNGNLNIIRTFFNDGKKQIVESYKNNVKYKERTEMYLDCCNKYRSFGWYIRKGKKIENEYINKYVIENNLVTLYTEFRNGKKKAAQKFIYDKRNLLREIKNVNYETRFTSRYKYKFYR
jgi:hypothetical protein